MIYAITTIDSMDSRADTVSVPVQLFQWIDERVSKGDYKSAADFCMCAIREYYSFVMLSIARYYQNYEEFMKLKDSIPGHTAVSFLKLCILSHENEFRLMDYENKGKKLIMIRMPQNLFDRITYFVETEHYYNSRQEFYRRAIEVYVDMLDAMDRTYEAFKNRDTNALRMAMVHSTDFPRWNDFIAEYKANHDYATKDTESDHSLDAPNHPRNDQDNS